MFLCAAQVRAQDISSGKQALLLVHFGTTYDDTRLKTIDAINEKARKAFPGMAVSESYSSRVVQRKLSQRGIAKDTPIDALLKRNGIKRRK